jgi:hypothetical protein
VTAAVQSPGNIYDADGTLVIAGARMGTGAAGSALASDAAGNLSLQPAMSLQAATPLAGFALQNGTPAILAWTAPADGKMHRVTLLVTQHVTSGETGGQLSFSFFAPDGSGPGVLSFAGGFGSGFAGIEQAAVIAPGTTVTFGQATALTAGVAAVWAEIWGS